MQGNDEIESEDLPWATLEATPVPLLPSDQSSEGLLAVPVPPFLRASPPLSVLQDPREGCGGHLWQAALELCSHLDSHPAWADRNFKSLRVLELGAGTGLAGMYAARRGATVLCTDLAVMLPILRRNVALNFASDDPRIGVTEYCWGTDASVLGKEPFDLILAADCVYLEGAFEPLLQSLEALMQPGGHSTLLLSYQHRRKAESAFFRRLWKLFLLMPHESRHGSRTGAPTPCTANTTPAPNVSSFVAIPPNPQPATAVPASATPTAANVTTTSGASAMGKSHKVQILSLKRSAE